MRFSQLTSRTIYKLLTTAHTTCCVGIGALLLTSCSSPPKPPLVDESTKRPVNARSAVELKSCQGDLSRATILVSEMARAGVVAAALNETAPKPGAAITCVSTSQVAETAGNLLAVIPFGMGSTAWRIEAADAAALVRRANGAALIMIRGRTDATGDSLQKTALARRRAETAAEFLQQAGVSKDKLRLTWQGAGDPVAGLRTSDRADRAQSRRVEIEFYAVAPIVLTVRTNSLSNIQDAQGKAFTPAPLQTPSATQALL